MALAANRMSYSGKLEKVSSLQNLMQRLRVEDIIFVVCAATCVYPLGYYSYVPSLSAIYMNAKICGDCTYRRAYPVEEV